jgi:hypothetical protein
VTAVACFTALAAIVIGASRLSAPPSQALASATGTPPDVWSTPNGDPFNHRVATSSISSLNVKRL